jgi:hypothetical protein
MNSFALLDDEDEPSPNGIGLPLGDGGHSGVFGQLMRGDGGGKVTQPDLHLGPQWARDGGKYSPPKASSPQRTQDTAMWTEATAGKKKKG